MVLMSRIAALLVLTVCLASADGAVASRIDPETCTNMRSFRNALESLGVRDDMALGPKKASASLPADRMTRIKNYVVTYEQILFRCQSWPRHLSDGMDYAENMPAPKPRFERNTFPLPVRKPRRAADLRLKAQ